MKSPIVKVLPNILSFVIGLTIAYMLKWKTTDLVWSLWLCSYVVGYLTLLAGLIANLIEVQKETEHPDYPYDNKWPDLIGGAGTSLFMLVFFSFHFGAFHAGHSVFLQQFFPLEGLPKDGFGEAFMNPLKLWGYISQHLFVAYGLFLIPAILSERKHIFGIISQASAHLSTDLSDKSEKPKNDKMGQVMAKPYLNIIRMHCLIFFFAITHMVLKQDSFWIYAVVYFVYFFPWEILKEFKKSESV